MIGVYFSGTGNTRFCIDKFLSEYDNSQTTYSIEEQETLEIIKKNDEIVIGYPVQYNNIPKLLQDYIVNNGHIWNGKRIFIIATMGLFSGNGAGIMARLLKRYGAEIVGGLHLQMPDSIGDVKALKRDFTANKELVRNAEQKICKAVSELKNGKPPREGLGVGAYLAGLFGQRLYFFWKTKQYTSRLKINSSKCPKQAITLLGKQVIEQNDVSKYL